VKLHVFSDLHEEMSEPPDRKGRPRKRQGPAWQVRVRDYVAENGADGVCVLAGDICPVDARFAPAALEIYQFFATWFDHVIFVPGNHEFYGTSYAAGMAAIRDLDHPKWHLLEPGAPVTIDGQRFLGGTMWFDGKHDPALERSINDFRCIEGIQDVYAHNAEFVAKVCGEMTSDDVVISHHLPSPRSVPAIFEGSDINCFFVSDQTRHILERKPKLWIHGHTHTPCDYVLGSTRIYANPRGYPSERSDAGFFERVRIDV
jgi:hypothetical protein